MTNSKLNQKNYNIWSKFYDQYPNPTVAIDELKFPSMYSEIENQNILISDMIREQDTSIKW